MASILEHNPLVYKTSSGFDYPIFYDFYEAAVPSVWRHQEVSMESDLRDWQNLPESEREVISGVLKGFVTSELGIGCYWGEDVCAMFPKPEIRAMARAFSFFETIHAAAYAYLNDVLGLQEYEAFVSDPVVVNKVSEFFNKLPPKISLAVYSGGGEGVSLYGSFALLLSYNLSGRFKGLAQIISWSCRDEALHSDAGCLLFKELVKEQGLKDEEKEQIRDGINLILENEFSFIDSIFRGRTIDRINPEDMKAFLRVRVNDRLIALGLDPFELDIETMRKAKNISSWFYPMVKGSSSNDFFAQSKDGANYSSKINQRFNTVDMGSISSMLNKIESVAA